MSNHIVGGELYYDCLGNNQYRITLVLYRNCAFCPPPGCAELGDPEYLSIFNAAGNLVMQAPMSIPPRDTLNPTYSNPCLTPPPICTEEANYQTAILNLPPVTGGYDIVYQRCCRTSAVVNLVGLEGATYLAHIPDPSLGQCNSSPRFNKLPPMYMCVSAPLALDYSASDPNGDSLVYSLCDPLDGADQVSNCYDPSPNAQPGCPTVPPAPPYSANQYISPYSSSNFTNIPSTLSNLTIDPKTGLLTGTPNQIGIFDVTVCVAEYRNGQLLSTISRDYQFTITQCDIPIAAVPIIGVTGGVGIYIIDCKNLTVNFANNTFNPPPVANPISYHWDFGVTTSTTDTSTQVTPSFTYPDTGKYLVQLVAIKQGSGGQNCYDTTYAWVFAYPTFTTLFSAPNACQNAPLQFVDSTISTEAPISNWSWNFGDNTTNSVQRNPVHSYSSAGNYTVTLIDQNTLGCTDTAQRVVTVLPSPVAGFTTGPTCVNSPVFFTNTTTGSDSTLNWTFGTGGGTSSQTNPSYTFITPGIDTISLIALGVDGCADTLNKPITIHDLPIINLSHDTTICPFDSAQLHAAGGVTYNWTPTTGLSVTNAAITVATPPPPNAITYTVHVTDQNSCVNTDNVTVSLFPIPHIYGGPDTSVCLNPVQFHDSVQLSASGGVSYQWTPATGLSATNIPNPLSKPTANTTYFVTGIDLNGCSMTDSLTVFVLDPSLNLILQNSVSICQKDTAHATVVNQGSSTYTWVPLSYLTNPQSWNTGFYPPDTTDYILTISNYCYTKSDSLLIAVLPIPQFGLNPLDSVCIGDSIQLTAHNAVTYAWTPGATLSDSTIANPFAHPAINTKYIVSGVNQLGCFNRDSTLILVYEPSILQTGPYKPWWCRGDTLHLHVSGANTYLWSPPGTLSSTTSPDPFATAVDSIIYHVVGTNIHGCKTVDSVVLNVQQPIVFSAPSFYQVCRGIPIQLEANGGLFYSWSPDSSLRNPLTSDPFASPDTTTVYTVKISNDCFSTKAQVQVLIHQLPYVDAGNDTTIWRDTHATLAGRTSVNQYFWEPSLWLQNAMDLTTSSSPPQSQWYYLFAVDTVGCINKDSMYVTVVAYNVMDIPTGFSPNGDGVNDVFHIVKSLNIAHLNEFAVFDRWGNKVFSTDNINVGWDGTHNGKPASIGVYAWMVLATTEDGEEVMRKGNVTLVR